MKKSSVIFILFFFFSLQSVFAQKDSIPADSVYIFIVDPPLFPGGNEALYEYIMESISYPQKARDAGIQWVVYTQFIIEKDGSISNIEILRGIGSGCDEEVIRVIKEMPLWISGMDRGNPVRVLYTMPVKFVLSEEIAKEPVCYLNGRTVVNIPEHDYSYTYSGVVVVKIWVDRDGNVVKTESGTSGTTISDTDLWEKTRKEALETKFTSNPDASEIQEGCIIYTFFQK